MSVLERAKSSFLGLKGKTPPGYEGERTLPLIPVFEQSSPARSFTSSGPDVTPAVEMLTEAGELMLTEDNFNIITE